MRAFAEFRSLREGFARQVDHWISRSPWLGELQDELRVELGYGDYRIETPIVYNRALDDIDEMAEPAFVLVADNPGKNEQLSKNRRYLVGQSGKLAEGWFRRELGVDFRKSVVLVNKTPIHTPKTAELRKLLALAGRKSPELRSKLAVLLDESQRWMAGLALDLQAALGVPLWVSGYGELRPHGLFAPWAAALSEEYLRAPGELRDGVLLFRHFSMNQFAVEIKQKRDPAERLSDELERIGSANRKRILGW